MSECVMCGLPETEWDEEPCSITGGSHSDSESDDGYADFVDALPDWHFDWVPEMGPYGKV
jgi:hypothetical protein